MPLPPRAIAADKGPQGLLKALDLNPPDPSLLDLTLRDPVLRDRASAWRDRVEAALAIRLGRRRQGARRRGDPVCRVAGAAHVAARADGFRLKDAVKRLD